MMRKRSSRRVNIAVQGRDLDTVIVDGRVVVRKGRATLVDETTIMAEADSAARALWARARKSRT